MLINLEFLESKMVLEKDGRRDWVLEWVRMCKESQDWEKWRCWCVQVALMLTKQVSWDFGKTEGWLAGGRRQDTLYGRYCVHTWVQEKGELRDGRARLSSQGSESMLWVRLKVRWWAVIAHPLGVIFKQEIKEWKGLDCPAHIWRRGKLWPWLPALQQDGHTGSLYDWDGLIIIYVHYDVWVENKGKRKDRSCCQQTCIAIFNNSRCEVE
jgi:hypothetical protein